MSLRHCGQMERDPEKILATRPCWAQTKHLALSPALVTRPGSGTLLRNTGAATGQRLTHTGLTQYLGTYSLRLGFQARSQQLLEKADTPELREDEVTSLGGDKMGGAFLLVAFYFLRWGWKHSVCGIILHSFQNISQ